MTPAETILAAGKLLSDPTRWCQGALARTATGAVVAPTSKRARMWDSVGVIYHVRRVRVDDPDAAGINDVGAALAAVNGAAGRLYKCTAVAVNDDLGHAAVLECLRLAYKRMRTT